MRDKSFALCSTTKIIYQRNDRIILEAFSYCRSRVDTHGWEFPVLSDYVCVRKVEDGHEGEQTGCSHIASVRDVWEELKRMNCCSRQQEKWVTMD